MKTRLRALDRQIGSALARRLSRTAGTPAPALPSPEQLAHVLVVRLDSIGDMVLTTPMLRALRRFAPAAQITLVVRPPVAPLLAGCPYVDRVLAYPAADARPQSALLALRNARRFSREHFRPSAIDLAIAPRWETDRYAASMLALVSGARWTLGRENPALLTHEVPAHGGHEVERNLAIIRFLGGKVAEDGLDLWIADEEMARASTLLSSHGIGAGSRVLAIAPGAGNLRRRWPLDRFAVVARRFLEHHGDAVVILGSDADRADGDWVRQQCGSAVVNLTGTADLRTTAAVLKQCAVFVGNDSGPMHLAAAAGIPVVEVSCHPMTGSADHPNSPARFGPWQVPHHIVRPTSPARPCVDGCDMDFAHCITHVRVEDVTTALDARVGVS